MTTSLTLLQLDLTLASAYIACNQAKVEIINDYWDKKAREADAWDAYCAAREAEEAAEYADDERRYREAVEAEEAALLATTVPPAVVNQEAYCEPYYNA